ncbi:MAG: PSD1 and planctomycete cytochrome C domain-containing protein [Acidobacteria bacterium]|nr:PSD1 and planctomycete cytochrome C domain-containing protein [Acidobacteriota bacterium]
MAFLFFLAVPLQAQEPTDLESQAKGIIAKRCLACHNAELKTADLVLENRENALKGGKSGPALVPNQSEASLMIRKVLEGQMPPGDPLSSNERETLRAWVEAGALWSGTLNKSGASRPRANLDWWSLQPLGQSVPPSAAGLPADWGGPIDRFVFAKMQEKGLRPAPPADRRTFIRRATFDLLGIPPTPEEVEAFVLDNSPNAYEKLIDRLLASPHYGERWGRHWLDVIRFGESHGYEQNHLRERAWPFRDYIIRSFNQDKPFSQMVLEQLAGDQVAPDDSEVAMATGFLVAGVHDTVKIENIEGELQKRANDLDDMVLTTGAAFLGLTVNCARCHDHKFDPISQLDYYRLQAAFAGVQHAERELTTREERARREVQEKPLREDLERINQRLAALKQAGRPLAESRRADISKGYRQPVDPKGSEEKFTPVTARFIRMSILATYRNREPALDELEVWTDGKSPVNVALASRGVKASARSTRTDGKGAAFYKLDFLNDGKFEEIWISDEPGMGQVTLEFPKKETISRISWSRDRPGANQGRFLSRVPVKYVFETSLDGAHWQRVASSDDRLPFTEEDREEFFLLSVLAPAEKDEWTALKERKEETEKELAALPKPPTAYIGKFTQPSEPAALHKRGNPMDRGDIVAPGSLSTLQKMLPGYLLDVNASEGERRLALARWIVDDRNGLTARVLANRLWHYHFGKGLVGTPSDFGFNGEKPTHPELLEWLARRLHHHGWRLKPLHKELMLSAVYRQAGQWNPESAGIDSEAQFLWRFPFRRLEAETLRDSILAVSGKLDRTLGGPGFRLYEYTVDNVATYSFRQSLGPETYRRAVYHQSARSVRDDLMGPFDCPDSSLPEPKRVSTTTALQALSLLNNAFVTHQAGFFAERLQREAGESDITAQVTLAFRLAFGRVPTRQETSAAVELVGRQGLKVFCRALLNASEFLYVL